MTVSPLTTNGPNLLAQVVAKLEDAGYPRNRLTVSLNHYLAIALSGIASESDSNLTKGYRHLLQDLAIAAGSGGDRLTMNDVELMARIINGSFGGGGGGTDRIELEDGTGFFLLEDGSGYILLEAPSVGAIAAMSVAAGGSPWFVNETYTVSGGNGDAAGVVDTVTPSQQGPFTIAAVHQGGGTVSVTAVDQGAKTFTVSGDWTALLYAGGAGTVAGSTGNNGSYSVVSAVFGTGHTVVTVSQSIPSAVADGVFFDFGILTVAGDHVAAIQAHFLKIAGSTGNDGHWANAVGVLVGGNTRVQVLGPLPTQGPLLSAVADGTFVTGGVMATTHLTAPGTGYAVANGVGLTVSGGAIGAGATINITSVA